jgi:hypothetical protein
MISDLIAPFLVISAAIAPYLGLVIPVLDKLFAFTSQDFASMKDFSFPDDILLFISSESSQQLAMAQLHILNSLLVLVLADTLLKNRCLYERSARRVSSALSVALFAAGHDRVHEFDGCDYYVSIRRLLSFTFTLLGSISTFRYLMDDSNSGNFGVLCMTFLVVVASCVCGGAESGPPVVLLIIFLCGIHAGLLKVEGVAERKFTKKVYVTIFIIAGVYVGLVCAVYWTDLSPSYKDMDIITVAAQLLSDVLRSWKKILVDLYLGCIECSRFVGYAVSVVADTATFIQSRLHTIAKGDVFVLELFELEPSSAPNAQNPSGANHGRLRAIDFMEVLHRIFTHAYRNAHASSTSLLTECLSLRWFVLSVSMPLVTRCVVNYLSRREPIGEVSFAVVSFIALLQFVHPSDISMRTFSLSSYVSSSFFSICLGKYHIDCAVSVYQSTPHHSVHHDTIHIIIIIYHPITLHLFPTNDQSAGLLMRCQILRWINYIEIKSGRRQRVTLLRM